MGYVFKSNLDPQLGLPLASTIFQLSIPSNPKGKIANLVPQFVSNFGFCPLIN